MPKKLTPAGASAVNVAIQKAGFVYKLPFRKVQSGSWKKRCVRFPRRPWTESRNGVSTPPNPPPACFRVRAQTNIKMVPLCVRLLIFYLPAHLSITHTRTRTHAHAHARTHSHIHTCTLYPTSRAPSPRIPTHATPPRTATLSSRTGTCSTTRHPSPDR